MENPAKKTSLSRDDLLSMHAKDLRKMARKILGPPTFWTVNAKKDVLVDAILSGKHPVGIPAPTPASPTGLDRAVRKIVENVLKERGL